MDGHGGKRAGAGRRVGSRNRKVREIADRAAAEGITPLEVMIDNMRHWHDRAKALAADDKTAELADAAREAAQDAAHDAAPYVHPRLGHIQHTGEDGGPITVTIKRFAAASD